MSNVVNPLSMNTALFYYNQFMDSYSFPHTYNGKLYTHSIPSSFLYNAVNDGCLWLVTLIVGVAGYSVYFDSDTVVSQILSLDQLNKSGVKDPALQYNQTLQPWEGLLSEGRSPMAPTDKIVDGLGIAYLNGSDLLPIYCSHPLQTILPDYDPETGMIIYDDDNVMKVKRYTLCTKELVTNPEQGESSNNESESINESTEENNTSSETSEESGRHIPILGNEDEEEENYTKNNETPISGGDYSFKTVQVNLKDTYIYHPIYGWGMEYKVTEKVKKDNTLTVVTYNKSLPLETVNDNLQSLCYIHNSQDIYCLKCNISGKDVKRIGANFGKTEGSSRNLSKLEFSPFSEYAKYHLTENLDRFYIPIYWMVKNWAPFLSWHDGTQTNSLQVIMMASAVSTFNKIPQSSLQGKSVNAISSMFIELGLSQKEKDQFRKIVANTQRIITLLEFIKRV